MKNKKRVLIVLLILIIILASTLGVVLVLGGKRDQEIADFKEKVENYACELAKKENYTQEICENFPNVCNIYFEELIRLEYVKSNLENPMNHREVGLDKKSYVKVEWENDKVVCTYIHKED